MTEKYIPPRDFTVSEYDRLQQDPSERFGRNMIQVSGAAIIYEDDNFKVTENTICNGENHWKEQITVNLLDDTITEKRDPIATPCICLTKRN